MISVIIPYNKNRGFLNQAIESVKNQTYKDYELILSQSPENCSTNINRGVRKAQGEWIKILAEDDILPPRSLELFSSCFHCDWVVSDAWNFCLWEKRFTPGILTLERMLEKNVIHGGGVIYKKELFTKYGGFDEELKTAEEYDFHLKLLYHGVQPCYLPEITYHYRVHGENKYLKMRAEDEVKRFNYIRNNIQKKYI